MPSDIESTGPDRTGRWPIGLAAAVVLAPYLLLVVLPLGSGWTFPGLLPDRIDLGPIRRLLADRDDMLRATGTSLLMSVCVGLLSTTGGLLIGRSVRRARSRLWVFLMYVPFVISPVVIGVCLYDLLVRLRLSGTYVGVAAAQSLVATSFAAVFFSEMWNERTDRCELLVRQLGGGPIDVWRHAVWSQMSGLIQLCFVQSALYSWLDYGLVSILGAGQVSAVTIRVFAYLREASVNQAALAGLILLAPPLAAILAFGTILQRRGAAEPVSDDQR